MQKVIGSHENELNDIELGLEELSLQLISIFHRYKENGIIDDSQYQKHVEIKEKFLRYLKNKRENLQQLKE